MSTPISYRRASIIQDCRFFKTQPSARPDSIREFAEFQNWLSESRIAFFLENTALSTSKFDWRASRNPKCNFPPKQKKTALSTPGFYRKASRYHILPRYHIFTFVIHVQITISQNIRYSNISHDLIGHCCVELGSTVLSHSISVSPPDPNCYFVRSQIGYSQ